MGPVFTSALGSRQISEPPGCVIFRTNGSEGLSSWVCSLLLLARFKPMSGCPHSLQVPSGRPQATVPGPLPLVFQILGMAFSMTLFQHIHRTGKKYDA